MADVASSLRSLEGLEIEQSFVNELPGDSESNGRVRQVRSALYSFVEPTPTRTKPYVVAYSEDVCRLLGLDPQECTKPAFAAVMSGQAPLPDTRPYAQCYGGHQFGVWAGQLGDGRVINIGEVAAPGGQRWEIQLKGVGRTPYSRFADGRAVMRSSLREYVASEALHHLGVPTTRALALVGTGDVVERDMFYNGNVVVEPGAAVCRVAPCFVRFGTFQLPASRGGDELQLIKKLADWVIKYHFPSVQGKKNVYLDFLKEVCRTTGKLVASWQSVGFVHGVLNTDNMSILGLTIDYGPFGFLDRFDPYYTPNVTDYKGGGRYAFRNQSEVCQWNLVQLAQALMAADLVDKADAEDAVESYSKVLMEQYTSNIAKKMGLKSYNRELAVDLMKNMYDDEADFTNTFRSLSSVDAQASSPDHVPDEIWSAIGKKDLSDERKQAWRNFVRNYRKQLCEEGVAEEERVRLQNSANPVYIARQHLLQVWGNCSAGLCYGATSGRRCTLSSSVSQVK
eukprot:evm.model.scf_672.7 EVM.evm.TU.scf_672.7   scf_672:31562-38836(-)